MPHITRFLSLLRAAPVQYRLFSWHVLGTDVEASDTVTLVFFMSSPSVSLSN